MDVGWVSETPAVGFLPPSGYSNLCWEELFTPITGVAKREVPSQVLVRLKRWPISSPSTRWTHASGAFPHMCWYLRGVSLLGSTSGRRRPKHGGVHSSTTAVHWMSWMSFGEGYEVVHNRCNDMRHASLNEKNSCKVVCQGKTSLTLVHAYKYELSITISFPSLLMCFLYHMDHWLGDFGENLFYSQNFSLLWNPTSPCMYVPREK